MAEALTKDEVLANRVATLPAWAREYVANLTRERDELQTELAERGRRDAGETNVYVDQPWRRGEPRIYMPQDANVRFELNPPEGIVAGHSSDWRVDVRHGEAGASGRTDMARYRRTLYVNGSKRLIVRPYASNALEISLTRD